MFNCSHANKLSLSLRTLQVVQGIKPIIPPKIWSRYGQTRELLPRLYLVRRWHTVRNAPVAQYDYRGAKRKSPLLHRNSNPKDHHSTFPSIASSQPGNGSDVEARLAKLREFYIQQIVQCLPSDLEDKIPSAIRQRRLKYDEWQPHSVKRHGHEENALNNWHTALMMLKTHYVPDKQDPLNEDVGVVRQAYSNKVRSGIKNTTVPPKKPSRWTQRSLIGYILDLANFKPPRPILFEVLPEDAKRQYLASISDVAIAMDKALHDSELRSYMTIDAANIALQYFYNHEMMNRARSLYLRMEYLYLDLTSETWNIMLRASASYKDIYNFSFLLGNMIGRGFRPNSKTWAIFVMALGPVQAKRSTIDAMKARGIMDDASVRRDVATQMVQHEFVDHIARNSNTETFFDLMLEQYGIDWLSTSTGNILISEVIKSAKGNRSVAVLQALKVLYEMKQRSFAANQVTMDILLKECEGASRQKLLVEILSIFENHWGLKPGREAHQRLFNHAWRNKTLNFLRTLWISACLNGFVSFRMQDLVMQSILSNRNETSKPDDPMPFKQIAGWFLVSVDPSKALPGEHSMQWKPEIEERLAVQGILAVKSNLAMAGQGTIIDGLVESLRRALVVDSHWSSQEFWTVRRKQIRLMCQGTQLEINRTLDDGHLGNSSIKRFIDRLERRKRRRLARTMDLRHKAKAKATTGLKISSLAQLSGKARKELTFKLGYARPHCRRRRRFRKEYITRRTIETNYSPSNTARIFRQTV